MVLRESGWLIAEHSKMYRFPSTSGSVGVRVSLDTQDGSKARTRAAKEAQEADELAVGVAMQESCSCRRYCSYSPGGYMCLFASTCSTSAACSMAARGEITSKGAKVSLMADPAPISIHHLLGLLVSFFVCRPDALGMLLSC